MTLARWVVVDDAETSLINYDRSWFLPESGIRERVGTFGMTPYLQTLHGINLNGSASFTYIGTDVEAWGAVSEAYPGLDDVQPDWECFVDGVNLADLVPKTPSVVPVPAGAIRWCGSSGLSDGNHTFEIQIKVEIPVRNFYLDQIRYIPSPNLPLDNRTILIESNDPDVNPGEGWVGTSGGYVAHQNGSSVQVNFFGSSISWYGNIATGLGESRVSWSMDDGSPTEFLLKQIFTTPELPTSNHTLSVTFHGSNETVPLALNYLFNKVGANTLPSANPSDGGKGIPSATSHTNISGGKSKLGVILGGILGGSLLILILTAGLYWYGIVPGGFLPRGDPVVEEGQAQRPPGLRSGFNIIWAPALSRLAQSRRKRGEGVLVSQRQPSQPIVTKRSTVLPGLQSMSRAADGSPGAVSESQVHTQGEDPPPEYTSEY
ncbi:hypothetical protein NP233_g6461 [Leucocoprinus birnbaumii]|uniref:Uncharacterized protein n=1 Tax=Leucocoprinus birnbaumii TaxID=56174 RepID=A0AAD5YVI4_9AGAR|nr:hypothetical protein NP233_g6461 [Leucocoprinus birnbaumii]